MTRLHRCRLFEITVGARFPSPSLPLPIPLPPLLPPLLSSHSAVLLPLSNPLLSLCPFPFPYPYPLNPARKPGERCKLLQRVRGGSPAAKRFWSIFRLKSAHLFHFHNDTFVIFTAQFGCVQRRHNKTLLGATCGHRPHNVLAVGRCPPPSML